MNRTRIANLWQFVGPNQVIVITTNGVIGKNGKLIMGCGAARQAVQQYPGIDGECAQTIRQRGSFTNGAWVYGFLSVRPNFGIFQVKHHWKDKADLTLIDRSAAALAEFARQHPELNIHMNFPGVGAGGLMRGEVASHLVSLPENVTLYLLPE